MSETVVVKDTSTLNRVPKLNEFARAEPVVNHRSAGTSSNSLIRTSLGFFLRVGRTAATSPTDKVIRIGNAYVGNSGLRPDQFQVNGASLDYTGELWWQPDTKTFLINTDGTPSGWEPVIPVNQTQNRGDVNVTLVSSDYFVQVFNTTLTANRTITLPTSGIKDGTEFQIIRQAGGAFSLSVVDPLSNANYSFPSRTKGFVHYRATSSTTWIIVAAGEISNTAVPSSVLASTLRQLVGNVSVVSGSTEPSDPLTAPFHLYVDDILGKDTYVTGDFNSFESSGTDEEKIAQKLKRIRNQRLECGYTRIAPFKTLNRAVLEAYIITSLNWYTFTNPQAHRDCVIIHMASGPQPLFNHPGNHSSAVAITPWTNGKVPTWQELIKFNDNILGGVILPRGCAFDGEDLRKTSLIAQWAPEPADIAPSYSNIRCSLYLTPDVHAVDFSFRDPIGQNKSLHLLYDIGFPSQAHLNGFYTKAFTALGSGANLSAALSQARASEYQTVGPFAGTPTADWDTVRGASPYPERISSRSEWGRGGIFIDGDNLGGLKSVVTAQYTGVSLQKDVNSLQIYSNGSWVTPSSYQAYIDTAPDNRRINPLRAHHHILAIDDAIVSDVSVFNIGHAFRCKADLGGEIVSSNGNHTFGGCGALATGYKRAAFPQDIGWNVDRICVPLNPSEKAPAIRRITLGVVASHSATSITLIKALEADSTGTAPLLLANDGYSLKANTYVWVANPSGDDWRTLLSAVAWVSSAPAQINISAGLSPSGTNGDVAINNAIGKEVYIRRVVDSRTLAERTASLELVTTIGSRTPVNSAILQTSPNVPNGGITRHLLASGREVLSVSSSVKTTTGARVTLRAACPNIDYLVGEFYRKGVTVAFANKHYIALRDVYAVAATPPATDWDEIYLHMAETYNPPYPDTEKAPQLVFDTDTDPSDNTASCGINWNTVFTNAGTIRAQHRSGSSVQGIYNFLLALGFSATAAYAALVPRTETTRRLDPASATDFPTAPSGGAASVPVTRWPVEFRRPSTITLSNFTYDQGAGRGNYSTALPRAQKPISASNLFSLYFTAERGGRVIVRGVNEEGQGVTNQGLTDAETGDTTLAGDVAGGEDSAPPTSFSDISINSLVGNGTWNLTGVNNLLFSSAVGATTTKFGPVKLAGAEALRSDYSIAGSNDAALDVNIGSAPEVVTLKGLNYWAQKKGVLTRRTSVVTLYVVPDSATAAGQTYNFNGTSATLTLSPTRSGAAIFDAPPITTNAAVTLANAVAYANAVYSPGETVNYQLANGPYWRRPEGFGHIANIIGATARFPETNVVASYTTANTKPTTDVKSLHDTRSPEFLVPCFGTFLAANVSAGQNLATIRAIPVSLDLVYGGSVRAVCWLSVSATLADTANFPDVNYSSELQVHRTPGVSLANCIDNYLNASVPSNFSIYGFWSRHNISVGNGALDLRDIILGAKSTNRQGDTQPGNVWVTGDAEVRCGGIYFLGNTTLTAADLPKAAAKNVVITNAIGTLNSMYFIFSNGGGFEPNQSKYLRLKFALNFANNAAPNLDSDKNFDTNCIHILDNNGNYGLAANRLATDGTRGAAVRGFIGYLAFGSELVTGGYESWNTGYTNTNKHHGLAGAFGDCSAYGTLTEPSAGIIPQDGLKITREQSYNNSLWQMATTGQLLTSNVTLTPTPGGAQASYDFPYNNAANLSIRAFYKGIDVNAGTQVTGFMQNNRFFG